MRRLGDVTLKARPETPEEMQEPVGDAPRSPGAERRTAATKLAAAHKGKKTRRKLAEEMWLKQRFLV